MGSYTGQSEYHIAGLFVTVQVDYDPGEPSSYSSGGSPPSLDYVVTDLLVEDTDDVLLYDPFDGLDERKLNTVERYLNRAVARGGQVHSSMRDHLAGAMDDLIAEAVREEFDSGFDGDW